MSHSAGVANRSGANPADPANLPFSFADIARRYDGLNRLMSLGNDRHWRRVAAQAAQLPANGRVLDVGSGTGDLALALLGSQPDATVVAVEPVNEMVRVAQAKSAADAIRWSRGDGLSLPFPAATFDAAVSGFLLRNVPDVEAILSEQRRVVRPGGRIVCLEMTWPQVPGFRHVFALYFSRLLPPIMGALSGHPAAYRYLPRSVRRFPTPGALKATMEQIGLKDVRYRLLMLGTVALHVATV